jgi:hypothetical protein
VADAVHHDVIVSRGDGPLVLSGPPRRLTAMVDFHNRSDVLLVLRDAALRDRSGALATGLVRQSIRPLVLRPHQERRLPLTVSVTRTTAPGEYHAELEFGGRSHPVVLNVSEVFALSLRPQSVVVFNRPGQTQRKRIVVTNEGNISVAIDEIADVDLEDDMLSQTLARVAIEPWNERPGEKPIEKLKEGFEGPVLTLLRMGLKGTFYPAGLSVRRLGPKIVLAPGETAAMDLEITLRAELPPGSRYRGRAPLLTTDLEIVVVSSADAVESARSVKPLHQAGKTSGGGASSKKIPHASRQGGRR